MVNRQESDATGNNKLALSERMFIFTMGFLVMCDLFYTYSIVTYIADIVVDFGMTDDKRKSGFFTGIVISAFFMGLFCSSVGWALLSDRYGRRRILLICMTLLTVLTFFSMFTFNYYYLLIIRFLMGILSGILPVTKTSVGENRKIPVSSLPMAFSTLNFWNCFGSIIAPLASGFFSRPTRQYPSLFKSSDTNAVVRFLKDTLELFPLLIPNFFGVLVILSGLIILYNFGYETNYKIIDNDENQSTEQEDEIPEKEENESSQSTNNTSISKQTTLTENPTSSTSEITDELPHEEEMTIEVKTKLPFRSRILSPVIAVTMYSVMNIGVLIFVRTVPIQWSMCPEHKGLGLTNYEIGILGNIVGFSGCVSAVIVPTLIRKMNPVWFMRVLPMTMLLLIPFYPELSYLKENQGENGYDIILFWVIIVLLTIARSACITTLYTCIVLIMSNSAPKERKGVLQGIANAVGGLGKGVGPVVGNNMLSTFSLIDYFPFDIHFTFFVSVILFVFVGIVGFSLPVSLRYPVDMQAYDESEKDGKKEKEEQEQEEEEEV